MKLSNFIKDVGRPVAYYPGLKKITGSTNATILLCQFLYWSDKTKDGWIWKNSEEIEEETGLTYSEQKTARERLILAGLIEEERKRTEYTIRYRVNQDVMNELWSAVGGKPIEFIPNATEKDKQAEDIPLPENSDVVIADSERRTEAVKKGDLVDGFLAGVSSNTRAKMQRQLEVRDKLEKKFHINMDNSKWQKFVEFAQLREEKYGEKVDVFIRWALNNGFNPIYWTPEKMKTLYPQAFIEEPCDKPREDFIEKTEKPKEDDWIPMPSYIGKKKDLT